MSSLVNPMIKTGTVHCARPKQIIGIQPASPLAWSTDGLRLSFVSSNFNIFVLSSHSDSVLLPLSIEHLLQGHTKVVHSLRYHPSTPSVLVSTAADGVSVWNTDTGALLARPTLPTTASAHDPDTLCCAWAFGGATLLVGGKDSNILVFDALAGFKHMETMVGHKAAVTCMEFDQTTARLATAGRDSSIKIWACHSLAPGEWRAKRADDSRIVCSLLANLDGHRGDILSLSWGDGGSRLYSGARDNSVKAWNTTSYVELRNVVDSGVRVDGHHRGDVRRIVVLPGSGTGTGAGVGSSEGTAARGTSVCQALTASMDGDIRVWDLTEQGEESSVDASLGALSLLDDVTSDAAKDAWEVQSKLLLDSILGQSTAAVEKLAQASTDKCRATVTIFPEDGCVDMSVNQVHNLVAVSSSETSVTLFAHDVAAATLTPVQSWDGHTAAVGGLCMYGEDNILVTGSEDMHVSKYNLLTTTRDVTFNYGAAVHSIAVEPLSSATAAHRSQLVFAGGADYIIKTFALDKAAYAPVEAIYQRIKAPVPHHEYEVVRFVGHSGRIDTLTIQADGALLLSGARDFNVFIWHLDSAKFNVSTSSREVSDIPTIAPITRVNAHNGHVLCLRFAEALAAPRVASCGGDHSVKVWEVTKARIGSGTTLDLKWSCSEVTSGGHASVVTSVAWGRKQSAGLLFSAGWDGVVKVWDGNADHVTSPLATLNGHTARVNALDTTPSGLFAVSVSADFSARLWKTEGDFACLCVYHTSPLDGALLAVSVGLRSFACSSLKGVMRQFPLYSPMGSTPETEAYFTTEAPGSAATAISGTLRGPSIRGPALTAGPTSGTVYHAGVEGAGVGAGVGAGAGSL